MKSYYITQAAYDLTWHKTKADLEWYKLNRLHKRETKVFANPGCTKQIMDLVTLYGNFKEAIKGK